MTKQTKHYLVIFLLLWLHVTVLDLFYVTTSKIVFLWHENFAPLTLLVHFSTAVAATLFYICVTYFRRVYAVNNTLLGEKFCLVSSLLLVILIGCFFI
ncbi:hypothetical protein ACOYR1_16430 [Thalassotalea piscium]